MSFRIGITIGDVVERNGDLLGDGVNIAARLEGIAPVGGICISRTVYEQVANKLSVQFADIGEQHVKNIPNPVHAYKFDLRPDDARLDAAAKKPAKPAPWLLPVAIGAPVVAIAVAVVAYLLMSRPKPFQTAGAPIAQSSMPATPAAVTPPPTPAQQNAQSSMPGTSAPAQANAAQPAGRKAEALVPETIPFVPDRARVTVRNEYLAAPDHKALAITTGAAIGFTSSQADDDTAKSAALDMCQRRADALPQQRKCEIYAVGNTIVYAGGRPPLPPTPWVRRDPLTARPLSADEVPMVRPGGKTTIEKNYMAGRAPKAMAIGPRGGFFFFTNQENVDEAVRRSLEQCGSFAGISCLMVAINDEFVVPVPMTMKAVAFFQPASASLIAPELRESAAQRLANGSGWTAVAAGAGGRVGIAVGAANEQAATGGAMADCAKQDSACRVIAIGPFAVEPK